MISSLLATALIMAGGADPASARKAYMTCLSAYLHTAVEKKLSAADFESGLSPACKEQEAAFRKVAVDFDVAHGIARRTSEQGVNDDVADMIETEKERYADELQVAAPAPK